jgi:hypothetical protein
VACGGCCFELFGFDVLCDASGWPWLLEVNRDPSLATDTQVDLEVKAKVFTDLLNVVLGEEAKKNDAAHHGVEAGTGWRRLAMPPVAT